MAPTREKMTRYPYEPDYAVPPGLTLQETIDAQGIDQRELAVRTGLSAKHINQVIKGVAPITHDTAIRSIQVWRCRSSTRAASPAVPAARSPPVPERLSDDG